MECVWRLEATCYRVTLSARATTLAEGDARGCERGVDALGLGAGDAAGACLVERVRQQGTGDHTVDGRGLPAYERVLVSVLHKQEHGGC